MTDLIDDAGRRFDGLSARETQEALADELQKTDSMNEQDDEAEIEAGDQPQTADVDPSAEEDAEIETEAEEASDSPVAEETVWTEEDHAAHRRMVEALLFAAVEPLDEAAIARRVPPGADIAGALAVLAVDYEGRGVILNRGAGKWRFVTAPDLAHILEIEKVEPRRLSRAALETLAIIAYHQPCTRADIEDVRGVQVSKGSLDQLLEIGWVRLRGRRKDAPGRPVLYGTTQDFLEHFGLESVSDLPGMADLRAAGLLDARLPPGFAVPTPADGDGEEIDEDDGDEAEFTQDFLEDEAGEANEA